MVDVTHQYHEVVVLGVLAAQLRHGEILPDVQRREELVQLAVHLVELFAAHLMPHPLYFGVVSEVGAAQILGHNILFTVATLQAVRRASYKAECFSSSLNTGHSGMRS